MTGNQPCFLRTPLLTSPKKATAGSQGGGAGGYWFHSGHAVLLGRRHTASPGLARSWRWVSSSSAVGWSRPNCRATPRLDVFLRTRAAQHLQPLLAPRLQAPKASETPQCCL
jgi:hypothetical protein